jgi:hypothetical protein
MFVDAVLKVHDNVVFEVNKAGDDGGAVSLLFDTVLLLPAAPIRRCFTPSCLCDRVCEGYFHLLREGHPAPSEGLMVELQPRGLIEDNAALFLFCVETPESFTQVFTSISGVLEAHDNVVFEANTAGEDGGAVSLPHETFSSFLFGCFATSFAKSGLKFDSLRQSTKPRRKVRWFSSNLAGHSLEMRHCLICLRRALPEKIATR